MNSYFQLIEQIISNLQHLGGNCELLFKDLIGQLKLAHKQICQKQCAQAHNSQLHRLIAIILQSKNSSSIGLLKSLLEVLYMKQSPLLKVVYQFVPSMLRHYIEIKDNKNTDLEQAIRVIQTNQLEKYQRYLKDNEEIRSNAFVRELYQLHFNKQLGRGQTGEISFQKEELAFNSERQRVKIVLLYVIYRNLDCLSAKALKQYLHMIYIYCGGENKDYESRSSFYHLQKKNAFNPFKYSISEQEMEWMLISLYELSIDSDFDRYELLAAINMIYKKTANESMFKFSEIAQSIIHILEDEYKDIFS